MITSSSFCPCTDFACEFNPVNHDKGCNLCIEDSLKCKEIPRCFFMKVNENTDEISDWSFESFVAFVLNNDKR